MAQARKKILCIEDDTEVAGLIAEDLRERGYDVCLAHNGRDGLRAMATESPDLVLCDINMPIMSGLDVLESLTAQLPRYSDVPFIFLTALADRDSELRVRRMGADDYVTKPIDFERLAAIIGKRLERAEGQGRPAPAVTLTEREAEALTWAARGKTSAEIAMIVGLTKATVDAHLDYARAKLGAATRTEAVVKAVLNRLIEP